MILLVVVPLLYQCLLLFVDDISDSCERVKHLILNQTDHFITLAQGWQRTRDWS